MAMKERKKERKKERNKETNKQTNNQVCLHPWQTSHCTIEIVPQFLHNSKK